MLERLIESPRHMSAQPLQNCIPLQPTANISSMQRKMPLDLAMPLAALMSIDFADNNSDSNTDDSYTSKGRCNRSEVTIIARATRTAIVTIAELTTTSSADEHNNE